MFCVYVTRLIRSDLNNLDVSFPTNFTSLLFSQKSPVGNYLLERRGSKGCKTLNMATLRPLPEKSSTRKACGATMWTGAEPDTSPEPCACRWASHRWTWTFAWSFGWCRFWALSVSTAGTGRGRGCFSARKATDTCFKVWSSSGGLWLRPCSYLVSCLRWFCDRLLLERCFGG